MKTFYCKICGLTGIRADVRKHIREDHLIKGKDVKGHSRISREMGASNNDNN